MVPNKSTIKKVFKDHGIQLGNGCMDLIETECVLLAKRMANRCKDGNIKRLTPELFFIAMGRQ